MSELKGSYVVAAIPIQAVKSAVWQRLVDTLDVPTTQITGEGRGYVGTCGRRGHRRLDVHRSQQQLDAREADIYAEWGINEHFALIPVVGIYKPEKSAATGGSQLGSSETNVYSELILSATF